jgi:Xaa-Pro aminopeptidase
MLPLNMLIIPVICRVPFRFQAATLRDKRSVQCRAECQNEATKMLTTGTLWKQYHIEVGKLMTSELLGLGLIDKADVQNENPDWPAYKKYFMHGTSHHMGLTRTITAS